MLEFLLKLQLKGYWELDNCECVERGYVQKQPSISSLKIFHIKNDRSKLRLIVLKTQGRTKQGILKI